RPGAVLSQVAPSSLHSSGLPEFPRGESCPFYQRLELGPGDFAVDFAAPSGGAKATVRTGDHPLPSHHVGIAHNALGHQLRVLDEVGGAVQHPWNNHLIVRQPDVPPNLPLMSMARIGPFK